MGTLSGPNSIEDLALFLDIATSVRTRSTLATAVASMSGDLGAIKSPFASSPIGVAFGTEYRRTTAEIIPDEASATQDAILGAGAPTPFTSGAFDVIEGFGETIIPLVENAPLIHNLTVEGGLRLSAYSNTGFSTTWKVGGSYAPVRDLRFRSVFQTAVRSPNIDELFSPIVTGLENLDTDPCAGAAPVGNPALTALCIAQGVPPAQIGSVSQPSAGQINQTGGGNPVLDVERADTFTAGFVFRPSRLPTFALTFDYYNIHIEDAISVPTVGDVFSACFGDANPDLLFDGPCTLIGRNPLNGSLNGGGDTLGLIQNLSNSGTLNTSGFDFSASYQRDLGSIGSLAWQFNGTYVLENRFQVSQALAEIGGAFITIPGALDRECVSFFSTNCPGGSPERVPQPQFQFNQRLTYSWNVLDVSLQHRYVDRLTIEPAANDDPTSNDPVFLPAFSATRARHYLDLTIRGNVNERLTLSMTIDNLTDVDPPVVGNTIGSTTANSGNTFPTVFDALGRTFTFAAKLNF